MNRILHIWRPWIYHGSNKKGQFFEGWFYKLVTAEMNQVYAIIPGVFLSDDPKNSQAFIQVLDGQTHRATYHRYPLDKFYASSKRAEIRIDSNYFYDHGLELNIQTGDRSIAGKLAFADLRPWPITLTSPGIMGWYAYVPFMECYHHVISLDHELNGSLFLDGKEIDFNNGRGYAEKDWGKSFPRAYVWLQSNHFDKPGVSLIVSVARIPWLGKSFTGFIIGLLYDGTLFRFTTYAGAVMNNFTISDSLVKLKVHNNNYELHIAASRTAGGSLQAPYQQTMLTRVSETLWSQVKIRFARTGKNGKELIYAGVGNPAALDVKDAEIINLDKISKNFSNF